MATRGRPARGEALRDDLEVFGRLENAFDEEYETIARYGTPGAECSSEARLLTCTRQRKLQRAASPITAGGSALRASCSRTCRSRGSISRRASIRALPRAARFAAFAIGCPSPLSLRVSKPSRPKRSA